MKLTYSDNPNIDELTFKKLLLLATELTFVDRPSIHLADNYGTVGVPSGMHNLKKRFENSPIKLNVDTPPNTVVNSNFYKTYFEKDLLNPEFIDTIFEGIENFMIYDSHFDQTQNNNSGEFQDFRSWLLANKETIKKLDISNIVRPEKIFQITNKDEAYFAFKIIAAEQSLRVTSVIHVCNKYESNPTSINPCLNKLISLRLTNNLYTGSIIRTRQLGIKLMDCIIPDEALKQITWQEILDFRETTKVYYENWAIEMNKLEAMLFKNNFAITDQDALLLFDTEINPRLRELKNEIKRINDDRFKNVLKTIKNVFLSGIELGTLSSLSVTGAIAGFIATNLKTPQLTDDIIEANFQLKNKRRSDGLTYLLKLQEHIDKKH